MKFPRMKSGSHPLLALIILGGLAGCAAPEVPKEQYFRLVAAPGDVHVGKPLDGAVEVPPFDADGVMIERPLLFTADGGHKLEQRNYAYWTNSPPQMLRDQLITYLRAAQIAPQVVASEMRVDDVKYTIHGTVRRLEQTANPNGGTIEIELALLEKDSNRLILSKVFHVDQMTNSGKIDDAVMALNEGMNKIYREFVDLVGNRPATAG
ncbi:MAG TPA: ABC-type transport auxiliary lipoprotein family protein [Dongiaceae bacterium]|nr:ABC-type transport auxiliary lipoprotein family protein [Dongiaceae bacterium]